jgi:hypothetical protein
MSSQDHNNRIQFDSAGGFCHPHDQGCAAEWQQLLGTTQPAALPTCQDDDSTLIDMVQSFQ